MTSRWRGSLPSLTLTLFFINLGGYDPAEFGELHRNVLIVEKDAGAAKAKALRSVAAWRQPHRDKLFEVETTIDIGASAARAGCALRLTKARRTDRSNSPASMFRSGAWSVLERSGRR